MSFKYIRSKDVSKDHYVNSKLYTLYHNIKARCYNDKHPDYKYYGKRGIRMQDYFLEDFENFENYVKSLDNYNENFKLSLDRIDTNKNYEIENLRWVNQKIQMNNTRIRSTNKSGYRNVYYHKQHNKWYSSLKSGKNFHHIGYFNTAEEAALAYNKYILENNMEKPLNVIKNQF